MKKSLFLSAALMALAFTACEEKPEPVPAVDPEYTVASDDETEFGQTYGKQKTVSFYIKSANGEVVGENIDVTVKVDESKVDAYNAAHSSAVAALLPEVAYSFSDKTLKVYKNNKKSLSADLKIAVDIAMADGLYVLPIGIESISNESAKIAEDATLYIVVTKEHLDIDKGKGTKAEPYLIYDKQDLMDMHEECVTSDVAPDGCVYFKMMADVDLEMTRESDNDWEPINTASPYTKKVDFNGNGKTIKNLVSKAYTYASFLGVAHGEVYDLTFEDCFVQGSYAIGIVGGYAGTTGIPVVVKNVKAKNCEVNNIEGSKNGVGGLFGRICEANINCCSFDGKVSSIRDYAGGIFGYDAGTSTVTNCSSSGLLCTTSQRTGGIAGGLIKANSAIKNCVSTMAIYSTSFCIGGIAGHCNQDNKASFQTPNNEISGCIAWNDSLSVRKTGAINWSSGAVIGFCAPSNTLKDCYRKNGLALIIDNAEAATFFKFENHDGTYGAGNLLPVNCTFGAEDPHCAKYDGKEAAAGETASAIAKKIGYDETIWDLSGATPVLK